MARVTVNRAWQMMFGRGIVETSDNFGAQGGVPTHPQLLDWLAHDFMASGWNYKALLKKIAMSATYRQSSKASPDLLARMVRCELPAGTRRHRVHAGGLHPPADLVRLTRRMLRHEHLRRAEARYLVEHLSFAAAHRDA